MIPPLPALTALKSPAPFLKKLSGLRNRAGITLLVDGEKVCREQGELQWTDYGISGVAVFQVSRFAVVALEEGKQVQLSLDFMPEYTVSEVKELLFSYGRACAYKNAEDLLMGILPAKLTPVLLREAFRNDGDLGTLAEVIKDFSLRISGYMGYEKAQVTRGGVDMREVTEELNPGSARASSLPEKCRMWTVPAEDITSSGRFPAAVWRKGGMPAVNAA